jgi:hypothetical protein
MDTYLFLYFLSLNCFMKNTGFLKKAVIKNYSVYYLDLFHYLVCLLRTLNTSIGFEGLYLRFRYAAYHKLTMICRVSKTIQIRNIQFRISLIMQYPNLKCEPHGLYEALKVCDVFICFFNLYSIQNRPHSFKLFFIIISVTASNTNCMLLVSVAQVKCE